MNFYTADYVLCAVTLVAAILGLFGGFSGALGFCAGVVAAGVAVKFGWPIAMSFFTAKWAVALVVLTVALLSFGIARLIVKRVVKGLLAQPADAVFGFLVAAVTGAGLVLAAVFAAKRLMDAEIESAVYSLVRGFAGC